MFLPSCSNVVLVTMAVNIQWCFFLHAAMLSWLLWQQIYNDVFSFMQQMLSWLLWPQIYNVSSLMKLCCLGCYSGKHIYIYISIIMFFLHPAKLFWWLWWQVYEFSSIKQQSCLGCYSEDSLYIHFFLHSVPLPCQAYNSLESNKTTLSYYEIFIKTPTSVTRNSTLWIV